jgi:hypothetical protein
VAEWPGGQLPSGCLLVLYSIKDAMLFSNESKIRINLTVLVLALATWIIVPILATGHWLLKKGHWLLKAGHWPVISILKV